MKIELNKNNKVILFIGRRGFSNTVICRECKTIVKCPKCDSNITYHKNVERFMKRYFLAAKTVGNLTRIFSLS